MSFFAVTEKFNLSSNDKCISVTLTINSLVKISNGYTEFDLDTVKSLKKLCLPNNLKGQQPVVGMFAYGTQ